MIRQTDEIRKVSVKAPHAEIYIALSSKGRTLAFEAKNCGSNPHEASLLCAKSVGLPVGMTTETSGPTSFGNNAWSPPSRGITEDLDPTLSLFAHNHCQVANGRQLDSDSRQV